MSTVICHFIYFNEKLEVFKKKKALRKAKNHIDNKNIPEPATTRNQGTDKSLSSEKKYNCQYT